MISTYSGNGGGKDSEEDLENGDRAEKAEGADLLENKGVDQIRGKQKKQKT